MRWLKAVLLAGVLVVADMATDDLIIMNAEARVGRPATPGSVAGVARRTTRRMVRRTSVYVATLPAGCQTVNVEGTTLQQCGSTYYQASGSQYEVVVVE
jgi:hypothetical protein